MKQYMTVGLSMLAGAALGAAAIQTLHAQAKPPAIGIAEVTIKDQDGYTKEFLPAIRKTIQAEGGKFLAAGGATVSFRGSPPAPRVAVIQWESLNKAQEWWNSQATKDAYTIGDKYADFRIFTVEGVSP